MRQLIFLLLMNLSSGTLIAQTISSQELLSSIAQGQQVYQTHCANCHRRSGKGLGKKYPPLAQSDYLLSDPDRAIRVIWFGLEGPIEVNGQTYDEAMAAVELTEQEVADVMNYILHAWGNGGPIVAPERVTSAIEQGPVR